jgi:hypothetical protein
MYIFIKSMHWLDLSIFVALVSSEKCDRKKGGIIIFHNRHGNISRAAHSRDWKHDVTVLVEQSSTIEWYRHPTPPQKLETNVSPTRAFSHTIFPPAAFFLIHFFPTCANLTFNNCTIAQV